jgi:hypothetical protein
MFEDLSEVDGHPVLARLSAVVDELVGLDLSACAGPQVLRLLQGLEAQTRRLAVADHGLLAEADRRGLADERGCRSTAVMLAGLLRLSPHEAAARVEAATRLAPRVSLTGEPMPAEYPQTAAAQADGAISGAHASLVTRTMSKLPCDIRDERFDELEGFSTSRNGSSPTAPRTGSLPKASVWP